MSCPTVLPKAKHTATVIFLHGLGDTGHGWLAALEEIALPYIKYICPNAPVSKVTLNMGMSMPSWFDIYSLDKDSKADEEGIQNSSKELKKLITKEEENGIPSDRILVGGFSQGGVVALYTLLTYEKKLAGCMGLSTYMPLHKKFPSMCNEINKATEIFLAHGDADPVVKYNYGVMTSSLLKGYYKNTTLNSYSGMAHSSCMKEMQDVRSFISKVLPPI
ncbi:acyl-protein thioesterase 1 isoform X2 [Hydra vulgaris]|uniref:palmitoyl-protein hydrolase n=1 Tax=Hydra vulgaris TaxID=6087 RepID=A0ABM4D8V8_HYDVU